MNYQRAFKDLNTAISMSHVWIHQAYHEVSAKYKRTILGSLWISGSMVATALSMAIIFGGIFGQSLQVFFPFVLSGLIAFSMAIFPFAEGQETFMSNANIIRNHAYPFMYYVFETVSKNVILVMHHFVIFFIAVVLSNAFKVTHWSIILAIPLVIINMCAWTTVTAMVAARFRDLRFLLPYVAQLFSVLTPVFWQPSQISGWRMYIVHLNPIWGLLEIIRSPLLGKAAPEQAWILAISSCVVGIVLWLIFFPLSRRRIPFWI
ncbi:ABC transporter permease [Pseudaquidulcibacter saccharophilus]|uniref:ABC transporter permease n=1 Tax=Pseudaquidulcibacter saccharophilus TaxID=2831900 RepID=UPI001EFF2356|nr:ABC transporter permease [Pseudaquidulcibacter saccharophilus]